MNDIELRDDVLIKLSNAHFKRKIFTSNPFTLNMSQQWTSTSIIKTNFPQCGWICQLKMQLINSNLIILDVDVPIFSQWISLLLLGLTNHTIYSIVFRINVCKYYYKCRMKGLKIEILKDGRHFGGLSKFSGQRYKWLLWQ